MEVKGPTYCMQVMRGGSTYEILENDFRGFLQK